MMMIDIKGEIGNTFKTGSEVFQEDYENLAKSSSAKRMTLEEAKDFVNREFGFERGIIEILGYIPLLVYRVGGEWRETTVRITRTPLYDATDYNYVLFRVCGITWECWNGNLSMLRKEGDEG